MRWTLVSGFAFTMLLSSECLAQGWEIGVLGAFGWSQNSTLTNPTGRARAGYDPRFAMGAVFGQNMYKYVSGEIRYMYLVGEPALKSEDSVVGISGNSNIVHYDLIFH